MTVRTTLTSGDSITLASPSLVPMLLLCCSLGTVGQVYTFVPGQDPTVTLGAGIGVDAVSFLQSSGQTVRAMPCTPVWTPCPTPVHVGSGPAVTAALTAGAAGCLDDHTIVATIVTGGANSTGQVALAYDGTTQIETLPVPPELAAILRGTVDVSHGASLSALHMDFTAPAAKVLTFGVGSLSAAAAGLKAATATVAAPVILTSTDLLAAGVTAVLANPRRLTFTTSGTTAADAPANVSIVGTRLGVAVSETLVLSQVAGTVTTLNEWDAFTTISYPAADGTGALIAIGYLDAFATSTELVNAINTLAIAAPLAVRARVAQTAAAEFVEFYSTGTGAGVTMTIDAAASTADTSLGFTVGAANLTTTGAAATLALPNTGITLTFPSGTYVLGDTYTLACTGPRASLSALSAGATAARNDYINNPFGFLVVAQPASTAANAATTQAVLSTLTRAWFADPNAPVFVQAVVGSPFHVASAVRATNETNIATADAAMQAAFASSTAALDSVAHDDVYIPGSPSLRFGHFRRTAALVWAWKRASSVKIAADVGDGICPGSLLAADGLTRARNENTASVRLGGGAGSGFSVLKATSAGLGSPKFAPGATRAGSTSRLRYCGPVGVGCEIARIIFGAVELWDAQTWPTDVTTGAIEEAFALGKAEYLTNLVNESLAPGEASFRNYSGLSITIDNSGRFIDTGRVPVTASFVPLGEVEETDVSVIAVGTIALAA